MKTLILTLAIASVAIFAQAQSVAYSYPNPDKHPGYYIAPVTTVYDSRYVVYDHTYAAKDYPTNVYLTDRITYHTEYDQAYDAATGMSFATPKPLIKSRVATRVVFMPECLQSYLSQKYNVGKKKHAYVVRTADDRVYYEVSVDGKDFRFDDMCNVNNMGKAE